MQIFAAIAGGSRDLGGGGGGQISPPPPWAMQFQNSPGYIGLREPIRSKERNCTWSVSLSWFVCPGCTCSASLQHALKSGVAIGGYTFKICMFNKQLVTEMFLIQRYNKPHKIHWNFENTTKLTPVTLIYKLMFTKSIWFIFVMCFAVSFLDNWVNIILT